jgi:hypothetical protein
MELLEFNKWELRKFENDVKGKQMPTSMNERCSEWRGSDDRTYVESHTIFRHSRQYIIRILDSQGGIWAGILDIPKDSLSVVELCHGFSLGILLRKFGFSKDALCSIRCLHLLHTSMITGKSSKTLEKAPNNAFS